MHTRDKGTQTSTLAALARPLRQDSAPGSADKGQGAGQEWPPRATCWPHSPGTLTGPTGMTGPATAGRALLGCNQRSNGAARLALLPPLWAAAVTRWRRASVRLRSPRSQSRAWQPSCKGHWGEAPPKHRGPAPLPIAQIFQVVFRPESWGIKRSHPTSSRQRVSTLSLRSVWQDKGCL